MENIYDRDLVLPKGATELLNYGYASEVPENILEKACNIQNSELINAARQNYNNGYDNGFDCGKKLGIGYGIIATAGIITTLGLVAATAILLYKKLEDEM